MRIGIDLGGTKIEAIALDDCGGELFRKRVDTPQGDYAATLRTIVSLVETAENNTRISGSVGVGIPGTVSPTTGLVKNANSTCLNGQHLLEDLQQRLAREIRIENDANCFAMSEATDGAADSFNVVFAVILGTGTGGGIVSHGKLLNGVNAIGGEWGHNPLPWPHADELPGPQCYCGKRGCIETYLSGPGLSRDYLLHYGKSLLAAEIVSNAETGNTDAEATLQRYENRLARALASVINLLDPEVIVLGGGMSNIARLYDNIPRIWGDYVFSDTVVTQLRPPRHGDSSGVRGAAWLWPTKNFN